jgi:DNA mismatch repair protein MSH3
LRICKPIVKNRKKNYIFSKNKKRKRYLVCVVDAGNDQIAIVGISLRTSALCYDVFQDNFVRSQLETRLAHLQPVEVLVCTAVASAATQALVKVRKEERREREKKKCLFDILFSKKKKSWHSRNPDVRVTPLDAVLSAEEAVKVMSSMYKDNVGLMTLLEEEHGLPTVVVVCLATMV